MEIITSYHEHSLLGDISRNTAVNYIGTSDVKSFVFLIFININCDQMYDC